MWRAAGPHRVVGGTGREVGRALIEGREGIFVADSDSSWVIRGTRVVRGVRERDEEREREREIGATRKTTVTVT